MVLTYRASKKHRLARVLAKDLADSLEGFISFHPDELEGWYEYDVYEWLEAWDFEWSEEEWEKVTDGQV